MNGLHEGLAYEKQPQTTSPNLANVRPFDIEKEKERGGQRPALVKAYSTQVAGDYPIIAILQIATTYITPGS